MHDQTRYDEELHRTDYLLPGSVAYKLLEPGCRDTIARMLGEEDEHALVLLLASELRSCDSGWPWPRTPRQRSATGAQRVTAANRRRRVQGTDPAAWVSLQVNGAQEVCSRGAIVEFGKAFE